MDSKRNGRIRLIFVVCAALLLMVSLFSYLRINNLLATSADVNHTTLVKFQLQELLSTLTEAESDARGFMLSEDSLFVKRKSRLYFQVSEQLQTIEKLTHANFSQQKNLVKLRDMVNQRLRLIDAILHQKNNEELLISLDHGREVMSDLRQLVKHMVTEEDMLHKQRNKSLVAETTLTPLFSIFLTFCALLILITSYFMVFKELKNSSDLHGELENNRQSLLASNNSLLEKNESLDRANKELESFTYISSHDLQEPLRKIQTFIGRIFESESNTLSETGKSYLQRTQDAAKRMQLLIQDLLAYSRVKQEKFTAEPAQLQELLQQVKDDLSEQFAATNAEILFYGENAIKIIPSQFNQVLANLISNALKFSAHSIKPQITIKSHRIHSRTIPHFELAPGVYSKLVISDNGIGFDPQYKHRIFEVFQRLHSKEEYSGTGIGLAIVKKIVDNHGGCIFADSSASGAVFTIYLPFEIE